MNSQLQLGLLGLTRRSGPAEHLAKPTEKAQVIAQPNIMQLQAHGVRYKKSQCGELYRFRHKVTNHLS